LGVGVLFTNATESVVSNKQATQSSTYNELNASLAIDGSLNLTCCASCMSTTAELMPWWRCQFDTTAELKPWWQVDLANFYHVVAVELFTRTDLDCQQDHSCGLSVRQLR